MSDERTKKMLPCEKLVTINENGKQRTQLRDFYIYDAGEYEFEMITPLQYKKLYFYAPEYFLDYCPQFIERKWIVECINAFQKYLGK